MHCLHANAYKIIVQRTTASCMQATVNYDASSPCAILAPAHSFKTMERSVTHAGVAVQCRAFVLLRLRLR
jgi:hypothetical protein